MTNVGYQLADGDDGIPDGWYAWDATDDLVTGMESFLQQTTDPGSPEVYGRIREEANARVVISRLDRDGESKR